MREFEGEVVASVTWLPTAFDAGVYGLRFTVYSFGAIFLPCDMGRREELAKDLVFVEKFGDTEVSFQTTWGIFSPREMDAGTRVLLEGLGLGKQGLGLGAQVLGRDVQEREDGIDAGPIRVVDLGCGYGAIGVSLAALDPKVQVTMLEKDVVASAYTQRNIERNGLSNATVVLSNGFEALAARPSYDVVLSNIPAKVGRELLWIFLYDAHARLKVGGGMRVVVIKGLRETMKKSMKELFGNYKKIEERKGYVVLEAKKET